MTRSDSILLATERSTVVRRARFELRERVYAGDLSLTELLFDPPACIATLPLYKLSTWVGRDRSHQADRLRKLGALAARDGINLFVAVENSSPSTRGWVAEHVPPLQGRSR